MAALDLDKLSIIELKSLQKDIAKAIGDFSSRKKVEAISALEEHAKALGFSLVELTGGTIRKTRSGAGKAKYRNPDNPEVTWSGQGRKPRWFTAAVEAGNAPESIGV
jgi:DNA-binding protein H-NS